MSKFPNCLWRGYKSGLTLKIFSKEYREKLADNYLRTRDSYTIALEAVSALGGLYTSVGIPVAIILRFLINP